MIGIEPTVGEEAAEISPAGETVADGAGQVAAAGNAVELLFQPDVEGVHQGARVFLADSEPDVGGTTAYPRFYRVELGIASQGFLGDPDTPNRMADLDFLKAKVDAGADYICTQLFFDNHDFLDFRDRCRLRGIGVPILAGIMPVSSLQGMKRMATLAGGARYPAKLIRALNRANSNPEAVKRIGIQYAAEQCANLLNENADGIHFYTLNKSRATREIYHNLGFNANA